nr:hypothetical protein [Tanacetum cinerariifolium]
MSDSKDSTVTYTTVSSPYEGRSGDVSPGVDGLPVMPEDPYACVVAAFQALPPPDYYIPPEDDVFPAEEQPLLAAALPTAESPGYIPESDLEEDNDEDPEELLSSDRRADRPEVTLPPRKRLSIVHCPGYEAGESSVAAAAARPIEGRRADYGFIDSVEAEIRRQRAEDIGYVQEHDTQDIYRVMEDTQGRQTEIFQRVEALVDDSQYHYETSRLVDQEARCSREAWADSIGLSSAVHFELQGYMTHTWVQDQHIDEQDTLIATLTTQLSSLQGHLAMALGEIRALQAIEQARAGAPEGASSST